MTYGTNTLTLTTVSDNQRRIALLKDQTRNEVLHERTVVTVAMTQKVARVAIKSR